MENVKTIADRLKTARSHKQWKQAQLAAAAGVSTGTVGNIEAGIRQSAGSLPLLAEALGVSHAWLAYGKGEMLPAVPAPAGAAGGESGLSSGAVELAMLYDMIPVAQRIKRAQAFTAAAAAIVAVLEGHASVQPAPGQRTPAT